MIGEALEYAFFQRALAAALLASVTGGVVGSLVVVRRMASVSGGLAHAAFGGVGLGYLMGFSPVLGATGFALLAGLGLGLAQRRLATGMDTLISILWALGMALGMLFVALSPGYAPDLMSYLFGSLLFVPGSYLIYLLGLNAVILILVTALFRQLRAAAFDEEYSRVVGLPVRFLDLLQLFLVALAVVALMRVTGVILVIALLTIPATAARPWADSLGRMMVLAVAIGATCSVAGLFAAYALGDRFGAQVPTGPLIVVLSVMALGISFLANRIRR